MNVYSFVFGPLEENTFVVYDPNDPKGECIIIDPGSSDEQENQTLLKFIKEKKLVPVRLLNTHTHLDHITGNRFISDTFRISPEYHAFEDPIIRFAPEFALNFGLTYQPSPLADHYLLENQIIQFGNTKLKALFTPGHSPGHLCFYCEQDKILIGGDALFRGSIGRTDLPFGSQDELLKSINEVLLVLPEETIVYPGHGISTTIGYEKHHNPYL